MNPHADHSPVKILALARLLVAAERGETEANVGKDLKPLVEHRWTGAEWGDRLGTALDELESAGNLVRTRKGKTTRLALTDAGRRLASEVLGFDTLPAKTTWAKVKSTCLPALALGRPGEAVANLKLEILRAHFGLTLGARDNLAKATDATAAKLLGLEPGETFSADNVLRKLLRGAGVEIPAGQKPTPPAIRDAVFRRELGDPTAKKPLDLLVTRSVGARQIKPAELGAAVVRRWVDGSGPAAAAVGTVQALNGPAPIDLAGFAARVAEAAGNSRSGRFGDAKVFISHVWRALRDDPAFRGWDADAFKGRLIEAHRARLLELGRADLVEAMDPADVGESATPYLTAVYHFVRTEDPAR